MKKAITTMTLAAVLPVLIGSCKKDSNGGNNITLQTRCYTCTVTTTTTPAGALPPTTNTNTFEMCDATESAKNTFVTTNTYTGDRVSQVAVCN
jgi:hypothetical protein